MLLLRRDVRSHAYHYLYCCQPDSCVVLGTAHTRRFPQPEILLWTTASLHPSESQTSECSDLLSRSRATFVIVAQRQPGKLHSTPPTAERPTPRNRSAGNARPRKKNRQKKLTIPKSRPNCYRSHFGSRYTSGRCALRSPFLEIVHWIEPQRKQFPKEGW